MKNVILLNLMILLLAMTSNMSCKKKSSSGATNGPNMNLAGMWMVVNSQKDGAKDPTAIGENDASILQFAGSEFSTYGNGPLKASCAKTQKYSFSGNKVTVAKQDSCPELTFQVESLEASKFVARVTDTKHTFNRVSDDTVKALFKKLGVKQDGVSESFKRFVDTSVAGNPTPVPTAAAGSDSEAWANIIQYKFTVNQTTAIENTQIIPLYSYIDFQGGNIVPKSTKLVTTAGSVTCRVILRDLIFPISDRVLKAGAVISIVKAVFPLLQNPTYIKGSLYPSNSNVYEIECKKFGSKTLVLGDVRAAMGSVVSISNK